MMSDCNKEITARTAPAGGCRQPPQNQQIPPTSATARIVPASKVINHRFLRRIRQDFDRQQLLNLFVADLCLRGRARTDIRVLTAGGANRPSNKIFEIMNFDN